MSGYGHAYLTSYGWTGSGTALRKGAIANPLAIPPKKNLCGVGKDRDEAFPFWDHLFVAASKAITIRVSSDEDEDGGEDEDEGESESREGDKTPHLPRTTTGILSNRRPISGTPASASASASASTSGATTPHTGSDTPPNAPTHSLLSTAKRQAAKRGLYARFFRGPVLGPDADADADVQPCATSSESEVESAPRIPHDHVQHRAQDAAHEAIPTPESVINDTESRKERKQLKKERRERRATKRAEKAAKRAAKAAKAVSARREKRRQKGASEAGVVGSGQGEGDDPPRSRSQEPPTKKKKKRKDTS